MRTTDLARLVLAGAVLTACSDDDDRPPAGPPVDGGALPPSEVDFTAMTWNIGNGVRGEPAYEVRIRARAFEDHLAMRLQSLAPDLVAIQEVLSPFRCAMIDETDPSRSCFAVTPDEPPVRRVLGPEYSIACDRNQQSKCIGVHAGFGAIRDVPRGGFALMGAETSPLPFPKCELDSCGRDECLDQTSVSTVVVDPDELPAFRVVNVHTHPFGRRCRSAMVRDAFALADDHPTMLMGDWNFEPGDSNASAAVWSEQVGEGRRFRSHHPFDARQRPIPTFRDGRALDRVITDFGAGRCDVIGDPPLHAGFDFEAAGIPGDADRQPDHLAVLCALGFRAR